MTVCPIFGYMILGLCIHNAKAYEEGLGRYICDFGNVPGCVKCYFPFQSIYNKLHQDKGATSNIL